MTCPGTEQWNLLSMDVLDEAEVETLLEHARACPDCRERFNEARRQHVEMVRMYEAYDRDHDELREQLMATLPAETPQPERGGVLARGWLRLGDYVMSMNTTAGRRAAAVLVPAACIMIVVGVFLFSGQESAFAAAIEQLKQAHTIVCRVTTTMKINMEVNPEFAPAGADPAKLEAGFESEYTQHEKLYLSPTLGVRRDAFEEGVLAKTIYSAEGKPAIVIHRTDRTYEKFDSGHEEEGLPQELKEAAQRQTMPDINFMALPQDPDRLLRGVRNLTADADRELGEDSIDGRRVVGYEVAGERVGFGPPFTDHAEENRAELWIDAESGALVRLVFHLTGRVAAGPQLPMDATMVTTTVYDQFELDTPLATDWFKPVIPNGYTQRQDVPAEIMDMPDEAEFIEALRVFGETAGRYPASLNVMSLSYEVSVVVGGLQAKRLAAEQTGRSDAEIPDAKSIGEKLQGLALYAFLEMKGQQPQYFGENVEPGDAEAVLVKWRTDDGQTRVVYGDLRVETVPTSE